MSNEQENIMSEPVEESTPEVTSEPAPVQDFHSVLPEDLRGEPSLQDFKDVSSLAKSYVSAQRMLGNSVRIPSEDASAEDHTKFYEKLQSVPGVVKLPEDSDSEAWGQVYNRLGRPENPDGYKIEPPEGVPVDHTFVDNFKKTAHEIGLTNKQVQALTQWETERTTQYYEALQQQKEYGEAQLREKWGDDYSNRIKGAKAAAKLLGEKYPEAVAELVNGPSGNNPALLEILSNHYQNLQEEGHVGDVSSIQYGTSSEEAKMQIEEITSNQQHPYFNASDPEHDAAVQKVQRLYRIAYPD